ncbi:agmatinase family protein [Komagataeibacter europaeus]|nr:agmatinase family protein [Komagataeibacter europaeus]
MVTQHVRSPNRDHYLPSACNHEAARPRRRRPMSRHLCLLAASMLSFSSLGMVQAAPVSAADGATDVDKPPPLPKIVIPDVLKPRLTALSDEQKAFLTSPALYMFARPPGGPAQLFAKLEKETPEEISAYVSAMVSVAEQVDFKPGRDPASIPLDTKSPSFNAWNARIPQQLNPKREPGPIQITRYIGGEYGSFSGIPTFAYAPIALTPEDLKAGKVDVAIVGAPLNMGSGFRDAQHGPMDMRTSRGAQGPWGPDMYTMVDPIEELKIVDYGDVAIDNLSTERSIDEVRRTVAEIARAGSIPVVVGGDHSLEYPDVAGITDVYGKGKVGVVHFDSHYDAWHNEPHLIDHGQPVYRVIHEGHVQGKNYIQVGLRSRGPEEAGFKWMRDNNMRYHTMVEVEKRGWNAVMERALAEASQNTDKLWISFDIDALDPAFTPGTGTPVPGGLTLREAQPILRRLCAEKNVVGFDIVEYAPYLDTSYKTALNANFLLNACLTGIAMRKKGITQKNYLSPLTVDHQRDHLGGTSK